MEIRNAFPIVAQALGGRFGVKVVIGGQDACTDGETVWLPALALDNHMKETAYGFLVHEAGHLRFTEFLPSKKGEELKRHVWNILEDARIEAAMCRDYPGARKMLDAPLEYLVGNGKIRSPKVGDHPASLLLGYMLLFLRGNVLGQAAAAPLVDEAEAAMEATFPQGVVTKLAAQLPRVVNLRSTQETLRMADDIIRLLEQEADEQAPDAANDEANTSEGQATSADSEADGQQGESSATEGEDDGEGDPSEGQGEDADSEADGQQGESSATEGEDDGIEQHAKAGALRAVLAAGQEDMPEDVYDQVKKDLIKEAAEWPGTVPLKVMRIETPTYPSADKTGAIGESAKIRAALQGLVQSHRRDRAMWKRAGNRVAHSRLARVAVGDSRIFRKEVKREAPNTAIDILVDLSGSMDNLLAKGLNRRMSDVALEAAIALALGLEGVAGVSPAVSAFGFFHEVNDHALGMIVRHGERVRSRLDSFRLNASGSTPLAEALLALLPSLLARREERKQVIVVTDGDPDDTLAAMEVIKAAEEIGVEMVGLGVGTAAVKLLFSRWTVIQSVADLKKSLFDVAEGLLLSA